MLPFDSIELLILGVEKQQNTIINIVMYQRVAWTSTHNYETFRILGINSRLTLFGCNGTNVTQSNNIPPIIVYLPNSPYSYYSNTSTFRKLSLTTAMP
jgi:lysophospholipase